MSKNNQQKSKASQAKPLTQETPPTFKALAAQEEEKQPSNLSSQPVSLCSDFGEYEPVEPLLHEETQDEITNASFKEHTVSKKLFCSVEELGGTEVEVGEVDKEILDEDSL